eukprot:279186_1
MYMNFMGYTGSGCVGQVDRAHDLFISGGAREGFVDYYLNPTITTFVNFIYVITGNNAQCETNHIQQFIASNVYLCVSYSNNGHIHGITNIYLINTGIGMQCGSEYEGVNLFYNRFYLCYKKESLSVTKPIITDLKVFSVNSPLSDTEYDGYTLILTDINNGMNGIYQYTGYKDNLFSADPDPNCSNGIINGNVCCSSACGICGGTGCSSRPGGADLCCYGNIINDGNDCRYNQAPCVIYNGRVEIKNEEYMDCIDVKTSDGKTVYANSCHGEDNQQWFYDGNTIRSVYNDECLDVISGNNNNQQFEKVGEVMVNV